MSDVSTWSPTDEANTSAPPDGWPEFMQPSMVNNTGRMMMGAVRRMYDQMVAGSLVLPYVRLAGDTITGSLVVNGSFNANAIGCATTIYAASTISTGGSLSAALDVTASRNMSVTGTIYAGAVSASSVTASSYDMAGVALARVSGAATVFYDRANNWCLGLDNGGDNIYGNVRHVFNNRGSTVNYGVWDGGGITLAAGHLTLNSGGSITVNSGGNLTVAGFISFGNGLSGTGGITAWNGNIRANTGNVEAALDVTAGRNISVAGTLYGNVYAGNSMNLGGEVRGGALATAGQAAVGGNIDVGGTAYVASILPNADFAGICGGASQGWHDVVSYNYVTKSDAALKEDVGPLPDTLALVAAVAPQAFQYVGDDKRHWGFVAQDVRAAIGSYPVDIVSGEEGRLGLDYGGLTAMLWKAVQELTARLIALENGR